jgi:putative inorganic carbon (hco3(-)) transporter
MSPDILAPLFAGLACAAFFFGLRTGLAALLLIRPLCDRIFELARFDVAGHAVSYGAIMNIVVICAMIWNIGPILHRVPRGLRTAWLPFLLMALVAVSYSPVQVDGLRKFLTYVSFAGMFALSFVVIRSERDFAFFLKVVVLSSVLPVLYGMFQTTSGIDWPLDDRLQSTFSHPNIFAFYVLLVVGVIFFLLATERVRIGGHLRILLMLYLIPLLGVLIMTKTRNAWAGCLVLFLAYGVIYDWRVLILTLVLPVIALMVPGVLERLADLETGNYYIGGPAVAVNAYAWRQILWDSAFVYIWRQPILGYGLDSFPFYSPFFFPLDRTTGTYAHSVYIQFLFETGFVGLICFLWIFFLCFSSTIRYWRLDWRGLAMTATMMAVYLICCSADNIFEYLSFDWCFWFTLGAIFAQLAAYRARRVAQRRPFGHRMQASEAAGAPAT